MARGLYTVFYYLLTPFIVLRLWWRGRLAPAYRQRIAERFGFFTPPENHKSCLWVHAVSVGETIAAVPLIKKLQQQYPDKTIVVTTMTPTGSERVKTLLGDSVFHVYAPYDLPGAVTCFIRRLKPELLIIIETELWPNMVQGCRSYGVPVLLANGRLSEKSAKGYQRFSALTRPMLQSVSQVAAQTPADAERFVRLGLPKVRCEVTGSIKFDIKLSDELVDRARQLKPQWDRAGQRLIWLAASTHEGEESVLLETFKQLKQQPDFASLLLVIVPRHPERFDKVAELVTARGFRLLRRTSGALPSASDEVYLADTMGELLLLLKASDIAFVGGSLIQRGGHNMLEPAACGLPIITGESDYNFKAISQLLIDAGGLQQVVDVAGLVAAMERLLVDSALRQQRGEAALSVVEANRGALNRLLALIKQQIVS